MEDMTKHESESLTKNSAIQHAGWEKAMRALQELYLEEVIREQATALLLQIKSWTAEMKMARSVSNLKHTHRQQV